MLAANPSNPDVIYAVGLLAFQLKDYPAAEEQHEARARHAATATPNGVRYLLGQIAEEQKQWPQAIKWYESIKDGDHVMPARMRTAERDRQAGQARRGARATCKRVAADNPGRAGAAHSSPRRSCCATRTATATPSTCSARRWRKQPDQPDLLYDLALTAEKLERFDLLEAHLRKLIQVQARPRARLQRARLLVRRPQHCGCREARKLIEKALELAPEDYFIIDSLGWVLYREGDLKGAARELRRAYGGRPDAEIGAHLGEVLWVLGERDEARRIWDEALKAGPENETLQKTIKRLQEVKRQ